MERDRYDNMAQKQNSSRIDFFLALALIVGALVLAGISWWLPSHFQVPLTADARGTIVDISDAFEGERIAIRLEGNSTRYTLTVEEFSQLPVQPEVGDEVGLTYEMSTYRQLRMLEITGEDGADTVIYEQENPLEKVLYGWQLAAFAAYGIYAVVCVVVYRSKKSKSR